MIEILLTIAKFYIAIGFGYTLCGISIMWQNMLTESPKEVLKFLFAGVFMWPFILFCTIVGQ